uniref:Reverse transcriptase zinc-binding domain-containing protein n=1 Tax=Quercus lobata TaxID=97700 RepID=A0A7N2L513_QUELO
MRWKLTKNGAFDIRSFYNKLRSLLPIIFPWKGVWKVKAPRRVSFFVWTAVWDRILTGDNLRGRRMVFVDWCIMCRCNGETVDHLLLHCDKAYRLWSLVFRSFGIFWVLPRSVADTLFGWWNWPGKHVSSIWNFAPLCLMWCLWRVRNRTFEDMESSDDQLLASFSGSLFDWSRAWGLTSSDSLPLALIDIFAYFFCNCQTGRAGVKQLFSNELKLYTLWKFEILQKVSGPPRSSGQGMQKVASLGSKANGNSVHPVPNNIQRSGVSAVQGHTKDNVEQFSGRASVSVEERDNKSVNSVSRIEEQEVDGSRLVAIQSSKVNSIKKNHRIGKQELMKSVQELASQAASRAKAEAAKNITPPKSAYQFEASWKGLSDDRALQARLLKAVSPTALPQIFKNALSASLLVDIIKCVATFFTEEMDLAIRYIENLTNVSRFDLLIMCLSSTDRDGHGYDPLFRVCAFVHR